MKINQFATLAKASDDIFNALSGITQEIIAL